MTVLDKIERISAPSSEVLRRDYIHQARPVILTDLFDRLPIRAIDTIDAARRDLGEVPLQVQPNYIGALLAQGRTADPQTMSLAQFLEVLDRQADVDLCCTEYPTPCGILNLIGTPEPCGLNDSSDVVSTMFLAGAGNFAHMHFDGDFRDVLMYQAVGTKRYVVIHPRETRKLDPFVDAGIERTSSVFLQNFSEADKTAFLRYTNAWDCVLQPGETLLMPMMAWHYVEYLEPAMSISFRLGRNRYCRFLAEQMPLRGIFLQAISQRFIDETALGPDDLAVFSELEAACRRPYPTETERRREVDRICLDVWQRITTQDEQKPYTVRDLRRIEDIQAKPASAPALSDPWTDFDVPKLADGVRVLTEKNVLVFVRGGILEAEFTIKTNTAWVAKLLSAFDDSSTVAALRDRLLVEAAALSSVLSQFQQRGWIEKARVLTKSPSDLPSGH